MYDESEKKDQQFTQKCALLVHKVHEATVIVRVLARLLVDGFAPFG